MSYELLEKMCLNKYVYIKKIKLGVSSGPDDFEEDIVINFLHMLSSLIIYSGRVRY